MTRARFFRFILPFCALLVPGLASGQDPQRLLGAGSRPDWTAVPAPAGQQLADHRRIEAALTALAPQRKGVVDAYVIVIALDADPVFNREAREAGKVLSGRFDAAGRTIVLASDEGAAKGDAAGSPQHLALALARIAELMDRKEDVLVLYSTSHGVPRQGLVYKDPARGGGLISAQRLAQLLDPLGFDNRLLMLQACYSGQFVPVLAAPGTIVATAASEDRSSFGCQAGNDWTLYGYALINRALREPWPLAAAFRRASAIIADAEQRAQIEASNPQLSIGRETARWMSALDARAPKVPSAPVGAPPVDVPQ